MVSNALDRLRKTVLNGAEEHDADATGGVLPCTPGEAFGVLKNARRRHIIDILADMDGPMELGDLAEHIAFIETDADTIGGVSSRQRKRAYISLYQTHLPRLANHGFVAYDERGGTVAPTPAAGAVVGLMRDVERLCAGEAEA